MQKTNIPQAESKSADLVAQNLEQLKQIFPEVIKEGRVDFEALNDLLGNYGDTAEERFCLNWAGKANARREAQKRSTGTLRPCPEESVDWDTTDNLYIEGDNLEVLKLLQKSYHSRVKMIYIDPPYNTGKDFVYKDNYADNMKNYLELTGQDKKLSTNTESDGRYHSNWLNMMYPRLKLARNLLTDDGVIFISIDDNEVANLRKVCDEIFGEENFVAQLIWERAFAPVNLKKHFSESHDYILCFAKNLDTTSCNGLRRTEDADNRYQNPDNDPRGVWQSDNFSVGPRIIEKVYEITTPSGRKVLPPEGRCWLLTQKRYDEFVKDNRIWYGSEGNGVPRIKRFLSEVKAGITPMTLWKYVEVGHSQDATQKLKQLFDGNDFFEYPKPVGLIQRCLELYSNEDSIILDFFSGSATTAHAVMQLNAEDGGNRKYICVQIPEPTPEESEARKAGYATIPEIAKERIRRAGKKIMEEQKAKAQKEGRLFAEEEKKLDTGFKVFKLDSSNINAWNSDPDNLETALNNSLFNIKEDRSEDDLLYEILIKYGIELTQKINRHTIDGKTVYEMGAGSLIVCLADSLSTAVADGIGKLYTEVSPEGVDANCRVVFKEAGFNGSDEVKTNTLLILKQHGITNVATV
ncbi:site-specific DNA-methyltransferase [Dysgonomonas capnocytophagoides]|uniref:site-specific DNA-methyltransferase n=1 Tax=Dysgonomonas capnocytophagoides TaxID=45254 RepID=UPI002A8234CA|nr:site-specific DNA-methyltransferase [Dysgonomonas capnocytophagoides]